MLELSHYLAGFISHYGIPALFVSVTLETLGAPLPGESAIVIASGAAARGDLSIRAVAAAAFVAAVLGDNIAYLLGRRLGRPAIAAHGARFGITEAALQKTESIVARYGPLMVVFARFVVVLRQLNGLVAGTSRMPWPKFLAANVVGAALWVGVWTTLAYRLGRSTEIVPLIWHHLNLVAAVGILLLIGVLVVLRFRAGRRSRRPQ